MALYSSGKNTLLEVAAVCSALKLIIASSHRRNHCWSVLSWRMKSRYEHGMFSDTLTLIRLENFGISHCPKFESRFARSARNLREWRDMTSKALVIHLVLAFPHETISQVHDFCSTGYIIYHICVPRLKYPLGEKMCPRGRKRRRKR